MLKSCQDTLIWGLFGLILGCSTLASQVYGLAESTASGGSNAQAVHQLGETGADVNIGLIGAFNVYEEHEAFHDKDVNGLPVGDSHVTNLDFTGQGLERERHDTWMAGIAVSRGGVSHVNDIGVAPGADIYSARVATITTVDWHDIENGVEDLITQRGCRVIMTGIAFDPCDVPSEWPDLSMMYDYFAHQYDVVFANAAGNNNTGIQIFGDAHNGVTTGGLVATESQPGTYAEVGDVSGRGPTDDGRRKPDVVAPSNQQMVPHSDTDVWQIPGYSTGQTSLAVPHTAGVAALLIGLADETPNPDDGYSVVIRAVIVNSTFPNIKDRYGASTNPADSNNTWHQDRGYGRIDALRAYQLLSAEQVSKNTLITEPDGWAYATVSTKNQQDDYLIAGYKNHRLVLTVTWNRKVNKSGSTYTEDTPRFYLNLTVEDSNGTVLFTEADPNNNLKKVDLVLPYEDTYTVSLKNPGINKTRSYGLAFELVEPIQGDLNLDYVVDDNDLAPVQNSWLQADPDVDAELFEDGIVNLRDFAIVAGNWLKFNPAYYDQ